MFHVRWCYVIIDISFIDETCESSPLPSPPEVVHTKIKKTTRSSPRHKNSPRTRTSPRDISRTRGESRIKTCRSIAKDGRKKGDNRGYGKAEGDTHHRRMRADSAATEGRKIDGWAESKNFPLQSALGFPLVGTSHESRRDIYSVDSRVSKFPPANTATSNNSGLPWTNDALFFPYLPVDATGTSETNIKWATSCEVERN